MPSNPILRLAVFSCGCSADFTKFVEIKLNVVDTELWQSHYFNETEL